MHILRDAGSFELLTPVDDLRRQLLNVERAGRTCYQSERGEITEETASRFVCMLLKRGHESVLEHSSMAVKFSSVSRGFTHEMVRHRLCGFSQESTRYVDKKDFEVVCPPHRDPDALVPVACEGDNERRFMRMNNPLLAQSRYSFEEMNKVLEAFYRALRAAGWAPEDARQILPTGIRADIVVSANWREWRHIFAMRTAKSAHWEIRAIMCRLLVQSKAILPCVFGDFSFIGTDANGVPFWEQGHVE